MTSPSAHEQNPVTIAGNESPAPNRELTTNDYWDSVYQRRGAAPVAGKPPLKTRVRGRVKRLLGPRLIDSLRRYPDYLLWEVILARHLPKQAGLKAVEIGCAPGWFLVRLHQRFGYDVFGVEYAASGVAQNRRLFTAQGLKPEQVIHDDFFSETFHNAHRGKFDLVFSRGFIEHFDDPQSVVNRHLDLLAPGGTLVISVPNKRGVNRAFTWLFHRRALAMHNLEVMRKSVFRSLFSDARLDTQFCDYLGTFSFDQFNTPPGSLMRPVLAVLKLVQYPLNVMFRLFFPKGGLESRISSPHLIYIGRKRPD